MKRGIMISQVHPTARDRDFETLETMKLALAYYPFSAIQTVEVRSQRERRACADLVKDKRLSYTYCITRILNEQGLNLSALDEKTRKQSVNISIECLYEAIEAGADTMMVVSGRRPNELGARGDALLQLERSLEEVFKTIQDRALPIGLVIEPLDIDSHKCNSLGSLDEAINVVARIHRRNHGTGPTICADTAHMLLNGESLVRESWQYVSDFHFCNCVTDKMSAVYGDYHIPFGTPGNLQNEDVNALWLGMVDTFETFDMNVFFEVLKQPGMSVNGILRYVSDLFFTLDHCL